MKLTKLTLFLLLFSCSTFIYGEEVALLKIGSQAPDATFYHLKSGNGFKVSAFKGKFLYIDFWATWCGNCQEPIAHLNKLARKHKKDWTKKFVLLAASIDKNLSDLKSRIRTKNWKTLHHAYCINRKKRKAKTAADLFKVDGVPTAYLIGKDGKIIWAGHPVEIDLEKTAKNLLAGKKEVVYDDEEGNYDGEDEEGNYDGEDEEGNYDDADGEELSPLKVGEKVPDTTFYSLKANKELKLSSFKGKVIYIDFWATWCGPCQKPMAHLNKVARKNKKKWKNKVCLIGASVDESLKALKKRIKSKRWTAVQQCYVLNPKKPDEDPLDVAFGVDGYPTAYLIGKDGKVLWQGHPDDINLEKEINKHLK